MLSCLLKNAKPTVHLAQAASYAVLLSSSLQFLLRRYACMYSRRRRKHSLVDTNVFNAITKGSTVSHPCTMTMMLRRQFEIISYNKLLILHEHTQPHKISDAMRRNTVVCDRSHLFILYYCISMHISRAATLIIMIKIRINFYVWLYHRMRLDARTIPFIQNVTSKDAEPNASQ